MMIKAFKQIVLGTALSMTVLACNDNEDYETKATRPEEPGDARFSSEPMKEGTSLLTIANIDDSYIKPVITRDANLASFPEQYPLDPKMTTDEWKNEGLKKRVEYFKNFLEYDMVFVNGGTFLMGATSEQGGNIHVNELPVHQVTVSDFYICRFEVTQEFYAYVMASSNAKGEYKWMNVAWRGNNQYPVDNRHYDEMGIFCTHLSKITGLEFTLPTEAQWEFAARGGRKRTSTLFAGGNDLNEVGNYYFNGFRYSEVDKKDVIWPDLVGQKKSNELGLYDMAGNVAEACLDYYGDYSDADEVDPKGPDAPQNETTPRRVCRGGCWNSRESACRISARGSYIVPANRNDKLVGFRVVYNPKPGNNK